MRTNLTTRALAALCHTSQSTVDPIIHHLVPVPARALRPAPDNSNSGQPWIIDATLIPVHDHSISAEQELPAQCQHPDHHLRSPPQRDRCRPLLAGQPQRRCRRRCNRRADARRPSRDPGDGGYRGINTITTPRRDHTGRIIRDDHYRIQRRIRARVEHVIARLKHWQLLRQCCRRGQGINHSLQIIAGLWNLKTHNQLRVNS